MSRVPRTARHGSGNAIGGEVPVVFPRVCERCSGRILVSKQSFEMRCDHTPHGAVYRAWHLRAANCPALA